jgi:hypothetical protein
LDTKVNDASTGLTYTYSLAVATGNAVNDSTEGLTATYLLVTDLADTIAAIDFDTLETLDLSALSNLMTDFNALGDRVTNVETELLSKASTEDLNAGLSGKADLTALNDGLASKADLSSLSSYATISALNTGLALKADSSSLS